MSDERELIELDQKPALPRTLGYLRRMGPGYMQSAMTLGGGTAFSAIFAGAAFGYELLWVAPLGMVLGVIVLAAVAHQTLSTGANPFQAMKTHAGPFFAYGWALSGILSSIIWQFAQYALASSMLVAIAKQSGLEVPSWAMGGLALFWCVTVAMLYESKPGLIKTYENIIKGMVWFILAAFAFVVIRTGIPHPGDLLRGLSFGVPGESQGVKGLTLVVSGLAAAVGANMVFVYPYTLRKAGWGRAHRRLARMDLVFGMLVPYALAASLILIASASVFYYGDPTLFSGKSIAPWAAAEILSAPDRLGPVAGMWVFGLGIVAMALSSITMQMLCSGFALCEMLGKESRGATYRMGMLLPAVGVLGSVFWSDMRLWVAVPTTVLCGFLLPISYVGFLILQRKQAYLKDDTPGGTKGTLWLGGMVVSTLVLVVFLAYFAWTTVPAWITGLGQGMSTVHRLAYAAARVVMQSGYAAVGHSLERPGSAEEIAQWIDWEATRALRVRLGRLGFGVAEAMDTAQRFFLGWESAERLIRETGRLGLERGFCAGAGTDHLAGIAGPDDLVEGTAHQCGVIRAAGGIPILLPMPWLSEQGVDEEVYVDTYARLLERIEGPVFVHWLGAMFLPSLQGYFPGRSFRRVMELDPRKVRGAKLSLLDRDLELRLRRELLERDQLLLTGDDFHFAGLILGGDGEGARPVERWTDLDGQRVALGDFSHALLGIFDGIAKPAGQALALLAKGDVEGYLSRMGPCEELARHVFQAPTQHYKAGLAHLAWRAGLQDNGMLVNHEERARDAAHYVRAEELARAAGVIE